MLTSVWEPIHLPSTHLQEHGDTNQRNPNKWSLTNIISHIWLTSTRTTLAFHVPGEQETNEARKVALNNEGALASSLLGGGGGGGGGDHGSGTILVA